MEYLHRCTEAHFQQPSLLCSNGTLYNFLLQQDNDPKHTSKLCKNYLGKKQSASILSVMERPAQSPDLNGT